MANRTGFSWCNRGSGTTGECDNMAKPGSQYCALHQTIMPVAGQPAAPTLTGGPTARRNSATSAPIPVGVYIIEELVARGWTLADLLAEIRHEFGASSPTTLLAYLDGRKTVKDICPLLARFFGTSVSLWKGLANQWDERSENGQKTGNSTLTVPHRSSE